jgi:hypothetical protein
MSASERLSAIAIRDIPCGDRLTLNCAVMVFEWIHEQQEKGETFGWHLLDRWIARYPVCRKEKAKFNKTTRLLKTLLSQ